MKYSEPKLTDLNSIGLTAYGSCSNGTTAALPRCVTGSTGLGAGSIQCSQGVTASAYSLGCVTGSSPGVNPTLDCAAGTAV